MIADKAAAVPALHDDAVVGHLLICVLLGKGGVDVGVFLYHLDVTGEALVLAQEIFHHSVLLTGLYHPVEGHILLQGIDHYFRIAGDGVKLGGTHVILGPGGGQSADKDINRDENGQYYRGDGQGIGTSPKGIFSGRAGGTRDMRMFHQLYLRFSKDCTASSRKKTVTLR